jgi:hypothetical protein
MKKIKKALRLFALVCLILLATLGIGIAGGIPLTASNKRNQTPDINIELVETNEDEAEEKEIKSIR